MQNQTEPKEQKTKINGFPDGYELVRFGTPNRYESYIDPTLGLMVKEHLYHPENGTYPIFRKLPPPPPVYRPFANASEFAPHRDRWVVRKEDKAYFGTVVGYSDKEVTFANINEYKASWDRAFKYVLFDDGSPFGVAAT